MSNDDDRITHVLALPNELEANPALVSAEAEPYVVAMATDLRVDGQFGASWLIVTERRVQVFDELDALPRTDLHLHEIKSLRSELLVGGGALVAELAHEQVELVRYSHSQVKEMARVCKYLGDAAAYARFEAGESDGKEPDKPFLAVDDGPMNRCPSCNLVLRRGRTTCPACLNRGQVLMRILRYIFPYWGRLALVWLLLIAATCLSLVPPYLTRPLVDEVLAPASVSAETQGARTRRSFRRSVGEDDTYVAGRRTPAERQRTLPGNSMKDRLTTLGCLVLGLLGAQVGNLLLSIWRGRIMARLGTLVAHDLRQEVYDHVQLHSLKFFDSRKVGDLMSRIAHDTESLENVLVDGVQFLVVNVLTLIGIGCVLLYMNWMLTLLVLLPVPLVITISRLLGRRLRRMFRSAWTRRGKLSAALNECLAGMRVVKAFAREAEESQRFHGHSVELQVAGLRAQTAWSTYFPVLTFLTSSGALIVWYVGGRQVIGGGTLTLGTLMSFLAYLAMFFGPLQFLTRIVDWMARSLAAAQRVFELLDTEPDVPDALEPVEMPRIEGRVTFEEVTFGYEPYKPVLKGMSLDIHAGEMVGLVGHSGAGKSTTINLLCRFYDPDKGRVLIDGIDVRQIRQHDLRSQLGVVLQETFLFHGSVAENIAYGKPGASAEEIMAAAKAANAHGFIVAKPDGYDTVVGERGVQLSGGERQRISIARAILHDPRILILDEATASVDTDTEREIQEAIARLTKGRTTIAIAHRLSTLRNADRLAVIKQGEVIELGTHDELIESEGEFHRLVTMQRDMASIVALKG